MASAKVFIVTGASKGIGAAIAQYLLAHSHKLVLAARSKDLLESVQKSHPGQVKYLAGDMTSLDMPQRLTDLAVQSFGKLDGLVINHGLLDPQTIDGSTIEGWKHLYDVNVFSCLAMAKAGIPELRKTKGCVVWLSSGAATKPYTAWAAYGSSKAAVNSISTHLAVEEPDITSITVAPGRVNTDMQAVLRASGKDTMNKAQYDTFVEAFEQGKLLKPEQPGHVVAKFVAGPQKDLSGQCLNWNSSELAAYQE
ncbi:putative oxidoreductase [Tolypocladium ophioglossoides CBS 100239]|uniref:Putative oxidoreductase n=1 Tax=Tolypocladium ophioglossoides (strain CBS 100239) TaxID=1163406 RepID=A0A0L0N157_TOLOC|nr:putative oxidoreductase [Tolypocladium ophioglossoides CBS 100239]